MRTGRRIKNKMSTLKTLGTLALGLFVSLGTCKSEHTKKPIKQTTSTSPKENTHSLKSLSGKIISLDEDCFPFYTRTSRVGLSTAAINFQYETMRIKTEKGDTKQILVPRPTNYQVGDNIKLIYRELDNSRITFRELLDDYTNALDESEVTPLIPLQKGEIKVDGIFDTDKIHE